MKIRNDLVNRFTHRRKWRMIPAVLALLTSVTCGTALAAGPALGGGLDKALSTSQNPRPVGAVCSKAWNLHPVFGGGRSCEESIVLRTSKSYIDNASQQSYYDLFMFRRVCENYSISNKLYRYEPFNGQAELDIWEFDPGSPGSPAYQQTLDDDPWTHHWPGVPITFTNGHVRVPVSTAFQRSAAVVQARPQGSQGDWSNLVQINRQTLWELKSLAQYLPGNNATWSFSGMNHPSSQGFSSEAGVRVPNAFHPWYKQKPSNDVSEVMYFVKNRRHGYIVPGVPATWNQCGNVWHNGHANALWWLQRDVSLAGDTPGEEWIVANAGELYTPPGAGTGCNNASYASNWHQENLMQGQAPLFGESTDPYQCPATWPANNFRNYIIGPEYVGMGWGIHLEVTRGGPGDSCTPGANWLWIVEANFYDDDELPGLAGASPNGEVLQLKFVEALVSIFDDHQNLQHAAGGHREDWFLGSNGKLLRIEDRVIGPLNTTAGSQWLKTRTPAVFDPDIMFRDVMECPMFTMTNNNI